MRLPLAFTFVSILTLAACADDADPARDLALRAQETLAPTLPRELVSGVQLADSSVDGSRLDLMLMPAADRAVSIDELTPPVCAIEALKALVAAGGTLRLMVRAREIGTVLSCPES